MVKKEVFAWLKEGVKSVEVRKGKSLKGNMAIFQSGTSRLELPIIKKETGKLTEVIIQENFMAIVPTASSLLEARDYLKGIYNTEEGVFTAYHLGGCKSRLPTA